jgi:AcrR family transcriptional regulator
MGRPREHGSETREKLLATAARLLDEEGVAALSVRRLSTEADVSARAVYSLFGDMRGLLAALFRTGAQTMVRRHEEVPRQQDPVAEILPLALAYRRAALEQRELYGLMFERAAPAFQPDQQDITYAMRSLERVVDAVARAVALHGLEDDPLSVATGLWGVVHGLASLELHGFLGDPQAAQLIWRRTITAATTGLFPPARNPSG